MASVLFGLTQGLIFGLGGFSILCGLNTKCFSFGKNIFENLLNSPMAFGMILSTFKNPCCHDMSGNPLPKAIPHLCVKIYFKSSKLNSPMILFPFISYQKLFLSSILTLGDLQRNYLFSFEFCLQTNFPV